MATPSQIADLRRMIGEPEAGTGQWTDDQLAQRIDAAGGDLSVVAKRCWTDKAAAYAGMVDTTESGSSRRLSQLQEQALKMAAYYGADASDNAADELGGATYTLPIVRV
jgi:hypothetical protein